MIEPILPPEFLASGPLIIAATGGSGTRVLANIVRGAGVYMGEKLNRASDAIEIGRTGAKWINAFMRDEFGGRLEAHEEQIAAALRPVFAEHVGPIRAVPKPWGWKAPRSIYLLPLYRKWFPAMRFLHVVRDGRDMAFSNNQRQLKHYGGQLVDSSLDKAPPPVRAIALWSRVNQIRAEFGRQHLGDRYLRIRFEDLCRKPVPAIEAILKFIDRPGDAAAIARREVAPPETIGRWKKQPRALRKEVQRVGEAALREFGYL